MDQNVFDNIKIRILPSCPKVFKSNRSINCKSLETQLKKVTQNFEAYNTRQPLSQLFKVKIDFMYFQFTLQYLGNRAQEEQKRKKEKIKNMKKNKKQNKQIKKIKSEKQKNIRQNLKYI
ncbi:hypothetical protein ABPG74_000994 [Tetrahymena malaccensis]